MSSDDGDEVVEVDATTGKRSDGSDPDKDAAFICRLHLLMRGSGYWVDLGLESNHWLRSRLLSLLIGESDDVVGVTPHDPAAADGGDDGSGDIEMAKEESSPEKDDLDDLANLMSDAKTDEKTGKVTVTDKKTKKSTASSIAAM